MSDRNFWRNWFPSPKKLQKRIDALAAELALSHEHCTRLERASAAKAEEAHKQIADLESQLTVARQDAQNRVSQLEARQSVALSKLDERLAHWETKAEEAKEAERSRAAQLAIQAAANDAFYSAFEARFRGSREAIMERQSYYLSHIAQARAQVAAATPPELPPLHGHYATLFEKLRSGQGILDLGSGRGEWLELLRQKGIPAVGVELNQVFLAQCQEMELQVIASDVIECLTAAPSESVAVVTGFHIIEHLPFPVLQKFVRESLRVLRPGGVAIFETPNPRNVQVGTHNFWSDPTHLHPAHPDFTQFLLENVGFSKVRLEYLTPYPPEFHVGDPDDSLAQRFNEFFYGPQDFALIGTKSS